MAIPKYHEFYMPVLTALGDGEPHSTREIRDSIAEQLRILPEERQELLPSSRYPVYSSRVGWACTYLKKAGLVENPRKSYWRLTEEGRNVYLHPPSRLDNHFLSGFSSFREFTRPAARAEENGAPESDPIAPNTDETPNDRMEQAHSEINEKLAEDLLAEIMAKDSTFFEELVVKLLLKMGYGGSLSDAGYVTQRTNDGGIDGIIREDKLGFDQIYIQAKRWDPEKTITRPEIHRFSGALREKQASKGLFVTTAGFSDGARASAEQQHIVLVDGKRLTKLMIEYNVGVSTVAKYEIKSIDSDFFNDDRE